METILNKESRAAIELMIADGVITQEVAIKYFPELKESEDERIKKELIDYFSASHATDTFRGISWDRVVAWLEKQGEQKKTTWNKEDEENMNNVLYIFNQLKDASFYKEDDIAEKAINWLKSLKDRYTWKPSDEQMQALSIAMCGVDDPLFSLYQDLKKLKG